MATDERNRLGRSESQRPRGAGWFVLDRLGLSARVDLFDRPLRSIRDETGLQLSGWPTRRTAAIQNADAIQNGASPALSRIHHRVLVHAAHDRRSSVLRD